MTVTRPVDVVFDPATWRDADAAMVGRCTDSPAWRVAAFQRLVMLAWSQRATDPAWLRTWSRAVAPRRGLGPVDETAGAGGAADREVRGTGERHWDGVIAGRQWLALPAGEAELRRHLGSDVVDECWRAALAAVAVPDGTTPAALADEGVGPSGGGVEPLARPRPAEDRGVVEAARRHLRLVAQSAGVAAPRVVRVYEGDARGRVSVSGVPDVFAYVTVPAGALVRAAGIDMPDGTRRVVEFDTHAGGFDRTHWTAT